MPALLEEHRKDKGQPELPDRQDNGDDQTVPKRPVPKLAKLKERSPPPCSFLRSKHTKKARTTMAAAMDKGTIETAWLDRHTR
jgi:hypothetical protein